MSGPLAALSHFCDNHGPVVILCTRRARDKEVMSQGSGKIELVAFKLRYPRVVSRSPV